MFSLENKVALVTGASRGLGAGIAEGLATAGADVIINYLSAKERAEAVAARIKEKGRRCVIVTADVSQEDPVRSLFETVKSEFGRLDILVNNAGTARPQDIFQTSLADWQFIINTNLTSTFLCSKYAMEMMKDQGHGRIIAISSVVGHRGALYGHTHYAASKSAQLGLMKTLARTGAPFGITANAVAPGIIQTELLFDTHGSEEVQRLSETVPLGLGSPSDVAAAVVFLASDEARYITGATIDVNGGIYMR